MTAQSRLRHQAGFDLLTFRRNPAATFFTVVLPLIFLVIFASIFGSEVLDNGAEASSVYVPGILALAIISATAVNLAMTVTARRERGVLKRVRGTPIPPWVFLAAQAIAGFVISAVMTVIIVFIGGLFYGVDLEVGGLPALLVSVVIGATSFAAMGLGLSAIIPSEDAAPAVTNAVMLPLYFISDVFIPSEAIPDWLQAVGRVFPVYHFSSALQASFNPAPEPAVAGLAIPWVHWLVMLIWGAVAALVTIRWFRWVPRR